SPGMAYGELGPTHHSIEDLSWLRAVADLPIVVPADPNETRAAVRWAAENGGPSYLRIGRHPVPVLDDEPQPFVLGRSTELRPGDSAAIELFEFFYTLRKNTWEGVWQLDQFPFREDSVAAAQAAIEFLKAVERGLDTFDSGAW